MTILCQAALDCTSPALIVCENCARQLCSHHYGSGSSTFCTRCFRRLAREAKRPAPAVAAVVDPSRSAAPAGSGGPPCLGPVK